MSIVAPLKVWIEVEPGTPALLSLERTWRRAGQDVNWSDKAAPSLHSLLTNAKRLLDTLAPTTTLLGAASEGLEVVVLEKSSGSHSEAL
jgi:hypothetical protein